VRFIGNRLPGSIPVRVDVKDGEFTFGFEAA